MATKFSFSSLSRALPIFAAKILKFWLRWEPLFKLTEMYQKQVKHIENGMFRIADEVIEEKERAFRETPEQEIPIDGSSKLPHIFIDQLYKKRDVLSEKDIHDEIITIIVTVRIHFCFLQDFNFLLS